MKGLLSLVAFAWLLVFGGYAQDTLPQRVLFVGNSYTYFWNLPQAVAVMAESQGVELITRQSTAGGSNLGQHWRGQKDLETISLIEEGQFDVVILQDHSKRAIEAPDSLQYFGQKLGTLAQSTGAKVYLYMTWARHWDPDMQGPIEAEYSKLATALEAELVPVGLAWQRARELRPYLPLFDPDGSHPSPTGTYLSACVFYGVLTGNSPVGLPKRLITTDKDGEKLYLNIQSQQDAQFCQEVAEEVIRELNADR